MATKPADAKKSAQQRAVPKGAAKPKPAVKATPAVKKAAPAKKALPAKKTAPATTIMMKAMFEQLAAGHDLPKKQANALLTSMVETVTTHLKNGDRIRISGLGILEVRKREAHMGRNPATGQSIQIAASKKIAFRPAKELKDAVS